MERILEEFDAAKLRYPKLNAPIAIGDRSVVDGQIDIIDGENTLWDTFDIRIIIPKSYPQELPVLFETGNKIPKDTDMHINGNGSCCLAPRAKEFRILKDGISLSAWIDKLAYPFLANQFIKRTTKSFASKEYSHYSQGLVEYYQEIWGKLTVREIAEKLKIIIGRTIGRNEKCYCGSGKKYKNCHEKQANYDSVPITIYAKDLYDIQREYKI